MIVVMFFGRVADLAGQRRTEMPPSSAGDSLFSLRDRLLNQALSAGQIAPGDVHMSLNRIVRRSDEPVADGDEVAFFSVFSGG